MTDPADQKPAAPPRQPTVQSGRESLFGHRDDRWDGASGIVEGGTPRWVDRIAKSADRLGPQPAPPAARELAPPPVQPTPSSLGPTLTPASSQTPSGRLSRLAVPLAILAFALATNSIILPLILLVLWVRRRDIAPNFQAPWEDSATVRDWLNRYGPKPSASPKPYDALLLKWLDRPPYQDPAALKDWVRIRLASVVIAVFGALFLLRLILRLAGPAASGGGGATI